MTGEIVIPIMVIAAISLTTLSTAVQWFEGGISAYWNARTRSALISKVALFGSVCAFASTVMAALWTIGSVAGVALYAIHIAAMLIASGAKRS